MKEEIISVYIIFYLLDQPFLVSPIQKRLARRSKISAGVGPGTGGAPLGWKAVIASNRVTAGKKGRTGAASPTLQVKKTMTENNAKMLFLFMVSTMGLKEAYWHENRGAFLLYPNFN